MSLFCTSIGDGLVGDLLFFRTDDKEIACAVVGERRDIFLHALAFADIHISLAEAERIEHLNVLKANAAVRVTVFRGLEDDLLAFFALDLQFRHASRVFGNSNTKPFSSFSGL